MRRQTSLTLALLASLAAAGTARPASAGAERSPREVEIEAQSGLQYDRIRFRVEPGRKVRLVLRNTDVMQHNLVITEPGERLAVVNEAMRLGAAGAERDYVPKMDVVLWSIGVLGPDEVGNVTFRAPQREGVYPYVCTFPGHGFVMYGAMYVREEKALPPLAKDPHVPHRSEGASGSSELLSPLPARARVIREFMPRCGPAAIAVAMPSGGSRRPHAYCFDAGGCRLRYAWTGGFIDIGYQKKDGPAEVVGDVYYRATAGFPLRFGSAGDVPTGPEFLGYRLIDSFPRFRYRVDGKTVRQLVQLRPDGPGIVQHFEIDGVDETVWYVTDRESDGRVTASAGRWENGRLKLRPAEAERFSITIAPEPEE